MSDAPRNALETVMTDTPACAAMSFSRIMGFVYSQMPQGQCQTDEPRQCSFCRMVSKNELSPGCSSRTLRRRPRIVIESPAESWVSICPSAATIVSIPLLNSSTRTAESRLTITGRLDSAWAQIGVMTNTSAPGLMIGPPAESEYAVEPVG